MPLNNVNSDSTSRSVNSPITVTVQVDETPLTMEVDTGAFVSLISQATYQRICKDKPLESSLAQLKTYSGEDIKVLGSITVQVQYKGCEGKQLSLVVVEGTGPSLLGRDWLQHVRLDWKAICQVNSMSSNDEALDKILRKYSPVFEKGLGTLSNFSAKLYVDPNPVYCKARPVPYAYKPKIEAELDRLEAEFLNLWTQLSGQPIVCVVKKDQKSLRICGDFKCTVNAVSKLDRYPISRIEDLLAQLAGGKTFSTLDLSQAF